MPAPAAEIKRKIKYLFSLKNLCLKIYCRVNNKTTTTRNIKFAPRDPNKKRQKT